jgi:ferredoxin
MWLIIAAGFLLLALMPWLPPAKPSPAAVVSLDNCNGCGRCFEDCPFAAITLVPRSDGKAYDAEAAVNVDNCLSCGLCVGSCPTATPFRRAAAIVPGIELPDHPIAGLRENSLSAATRFGDGPRLLVYACERCGMDSVSVDNTQVLTMPCTGMLPPSFIDFALSRGLADGVVLAGCASGDCYYRLGDTWASQRLNGQRDPYLRNRVDRGRLRHLHLRAASARQRRRQLEDFKDALIDLPSNKPQKSQRDA